jgi:hypothetical protein
MNEWRKRVADGSRRLKMGGIDNRLGEYCVDLFNWSVIQLVCQHISNMDKHTKQPSRMKTSGWVKWLLLDENSLSHLLNGWQNIPHWNLGGNVDMKGVGKYIGIPWSLTPEKFDPKITIHSNANLFSHEICNGLNE